MIQSIFLGVLFCIAWPVQATNSSSVAHDEQDPAYGEREKLRRFIGLRHKPGHKVVIKPMPVVHHGLHMLNHQVGPLKTKTVNPFTQHRHTTVTSRVAVDATKTAPIAAHVEKNTKKWDNIKMTRADICVEMGKEHGMQFDNKEKCEAFMGKECPLPPPPELKDKVGIICNEWFVLLNMADQGASKEQIMQEIHLHSTVGMAPSPAIAGAPYGMPTPGMNADEPLPEQGFHGELVAHDNMVTQTSDWHSEYGPHSGPSYEEICAKYPDNTWCRLRGYHGKAEPPAPESDPEPTFSMRPSMIASLVVCVCVVLAAVGFFT